MKKDMTPYEILYNKAPELMRLRVPFCKVWFHVETNNKLAQRAQEGTFVGYTKSQSQFMVLNKSGHKIKVTNPIFMEEEPGWLLTQPGEQDFATDNMFKCLFVNAEVVRDKGILGGIQRDMEDIGGLPEPANQSTGIRDHMTPAPNAENLNSNSNLRQPSLSPSPSSSPTFVSNSNSYSFPNSPTNEERISLSAEPAAPPIC